MFLGLFNTPAHHLHRFANIPVAKGIGFRLLDRLPVIAPLLSDRVGNELGDGGHDRMFNPACNLAK